MREFTWIFQLTRGASSSDCKGDVAGKASKLGGAAYQDRSLPVVSPANTASAFKLGAGARNAATRVGTGGGDQGKVFRVQVSGYRANNVQKFSRYRQVRRCITCPSTSFRSSFGEFMPKVDKSPASLQ